MILETRISKLTEDNKMPRKARLVAIFNQTVIRGSKEICEMDGLEHALAFGYNLHCWINVDLLTFLLLYGYIS